LLFLPSSFGNNLVKVLSCAHGEKQDGTLQTHLGSAGQGSEEERDGPSKASWNKYPGGRRPTITRASCEKEQWEVAATPEAEQFNLKDFDVG
jgi:hypothetical protein